VPGAPPSCGKDHETRSGGSAGAERIIDRCRVEVAQDLELARGDHLIIAGEQRQLQRA